MRLIDRRRPKDQLELALPTESGGEAQRAVDKGAEPPMAKRGTERPTDTAQLMEEICESENLRRALHHVMSKKGSPGVDGMNVERLPDYLRRNWARHRAQLLEGTYEPQPVKRVEIPKPAGGTRKLGVPTVLDRFIQQAVLQVLSPRWDPTFSEHVFGFRPGRSAHQAVAEAQQYIAEGYSIVVDIDLEKFFDRVNHDLLMSRVARKEGDKRVLKLIRAFLNAGVLENGLVSPTDEGTPQGGPLSPLLSNLMLDDLDRELERRGHRFVRYADDCNVYVRSERAGRRVMDSLKQFITRKLKLKVNESKSAVDAPVNRKFLGFSFTSTLPLRRRIAPAARERLKERVRAMTGRSRGRSLSQIVEELAKYIRGWRAYFGFCETPSVLRQLDAWLRRRLRCLVWKQWKTRQNRLRELRRLGVREDLAWSTATSSRGPWHSSFCHALCYALPNAYWDSLGLPRLAAM
jgi:RNA-directed DNA polymerase